MARYDYSGINATAKRLIERFGRTLMLRQQVQSGPDYDPTFTNTDRQAIGVVEDYTRTSIDSGIQAGDKRILLASDALVSDADQVIDNGTTYQVVRVMETQPGDTVVLYTLQVRA